MNNEQSTPLEEVLHQIMLEESELSHEVVTRWVKRYPEYRAELTQFFATRAVQKAMPETSVVDETLAGQLMVSKALNLLHKQQAARVVQSGAVKALRVCDAIKTCGLSEEEFVARCGLDELILAKLDRRLIRFLSIPLRCFQRIAAALAWGVEEVRAMQAGEPIPLGSYKARQRPEVKVEDFIDAVRSSNLSAEAKAEWIEAVSEGNSNGRNE